MTYSVECIRLVTDSLIAYVDVEADTEKQAKERALEIAGDKDLYQFDQRAEWDRVDRVERLSEETSEKDPR